MGEIADMMLDGMLCEGCGVYMHGEPPGHTRKCADCIRSYREESVHLKLQQKEKCQHCNKMIRKIGMRDHIRDVHLHVTKDVK